MRRLSYLLIFSMMLVTSYRVYSFVVFDPSVYGQALMTANNTLNQLTEIKKQLEIMKKQKAIMEQQRLTLNADQYQWSNAERLINQLGNIAQQNNALAYSGQHIDADFRQHFPGYQAPEDYSQQYQQITKMTLNTLNNILQTVGTNANNFQDENKRLAFLQQQEQNSDNQLRAIQAASQIASEEVSQTQLLRQTMIAQTNAQTTFYASQVQNEASSRAELEKIINNGAKTAPAIGHSGNALKIPDFNQ